MAYRFGEIVGKFVWQTDSEISAASSFETRRIGIFEKIFQKKKKLFGSTLKWCVFVWIDFIFELKFN